VKKARVLLITKLDKHWSIYLAFASLSDNF